MSLRVINVHMKALGLHNRAMQWKLQPADSYELHPECSISLSTISYPHKEAQAVGEFPKLIPSVNKLGLDSHPRGRVCQLFHNLIKILRAQ